MATRPRLTVASTWAFEEVGVGGVVPKENLDSRKNG